MKNLYRITLVALLSQMLVFGAACNRAEEASRSSAQPSVSEKQENTSTEPVSDKEAEKKKEKELRMEEMRKRVRERWKKRNESRRIQSKRRP
jgi:hypothetical protein